MRARTWALSFVIVVLVIVAAIFGWLQRRPPPPTAELACHAGVYANVDGRLVTLTPTDGGLRYRLESGDTGKLTRQDGAHWLGTRGWSDSGAASASATIGECGANEIGFALDSESSARYVRRDFEIRDTRFDSTGTELAGRLVLPAGRDRVPLVVIVHGSENTSALAYYHEQYRYPAQGVATFVYDKRGTGESDGRYTQDFEVLARDAAAALTEARRLAGERAGRAGLFGASQGGWIAPLAATQVPVDFVLVAYGLADGPLAEDASEVRDHLAELGYGADVLANAREVTDATSRVVASRFRGGYAELAAVKDKYAGAPWLANVQGDFSQDVLKYPGWLLRVLGPVFDVGTSWDYDPVPVLRAVAAPQLWILAGRDSEAPFEETLRRLASLQAEGRNIATAVFPGTDHGIVEFETVDGERVATRYAEGYFPMTVDWIKGLPLSQGYGRAELTPPSRAHQALASATGFGNLRR